MMGGLALQCRKQPLTARVRQASSIRWERKKSLRQSLTRYGMSLWTCAGSTQQILGHRQATAMIMSEHALAQAGWALECIQTWLHNVTLVSGARLAKWGGSV